MVHLPYIHELLGAIFRYPFILAGEICWVSPPKDGKCTTNYPEVGYTVVNESCSSIGLGLLVFSSQEQLDNTAETRKYVVLIFQNRTLRDTR